MEISECRICKSDDLRLFLDLGEHPMADAFIAPDLLGEPETFTPLQVCSCQNCGLIQLKHVVPATQLYDENYIYESSITRLGQRHWAEFAQTASKIAKLEDQELVIDIGSNVGVLLEKFQSHGATVIGVDPAPVIVDIAHKRGIETIEGFFDIEIAKKIKGDKKPAKLITATNVFAHIDDLHALMTAIDEVLAKDGIFIIEAPYAPNLIKSLEYDTIYHEHLSYLSIKPLKALLEKFQMELFEVQQRDIHGGSFRCYIRRQNSNGASVSKTIADLLELEQRRGIYQIDQLEDFALRVSDHRAKLLALLTNLKKEGRSIVGVSAPAKGMTLLNYCDIGPDMLDFITEKSALKIGRFSPGQHIPIVPDEKLLETQPDYALILAWNFAEEIMENLNGYLNAGGKFIIPIPEPNIVG